MASKTTDSFLASAPFMGATRNACDSFMLDTALYIDEDHFYRRPSLYLHADQLSIVDLSIDLHMSSTGITVHAQRSSCTELVQPEQLGERCRRRYVCF